MKNVEYRIISIGALSSNSFWDETADVRTAHSTTTLIESGNKKILVDPSLPGEVLNARLFERAGIRIADITTVFLTTFRRTHRNALASFTHAQWLIHSDEKAHTRQRLEELAGTVSRESPESLSAIENELALLNSCEDSPEKLADQVEIFPSPGPSAGSCGLILTPPVGVIIVAGDAIINRDYLENGKVWDHSFDIAKAQKSMEDILEIADLIIPGHDNIIPLMGKLI